MAQEDGKASSVGAEPSVGATSTLSEDVSMLKASEDRADRVEQVSVSVVAPVRSVLESEVLAVVVSSMVVSSAESQSTVWQDKS